VGATALWWTLGTEIGAERLSQTSWRRKTRSLTDQHELIDRLDRWMPQGLGSETLNSQKPEG
jgi:hypothetical protein